jgi:putative nucleotidyltransferase with HDIG domain
MTAGSPNKLSVKERHGCPCVLIVKEQAMKQATQSHYITPDDLSIGYYVHLDLGWMDHPFTFSHFLIKNEEQITKIRALNLWQIRYDPLRSTVVPAATKIDDFPKTIQIDPAPRAAKPSPTQKSDRLKQLNSLRLNCEKAFSKNANSAREAIRILIHHPEHAKKIAENLVDEMVNSIITESDVTLHAIRSEANTGHSNHSINVSVLALMLAKSLDVQKEEAATLGMASIFHDVGKAENHQNRSYVDLHCEAGERIARHSGLSERTANIIRQHHEYSDGSGYPMHMTNDQIDALARILILVNHYDNLCNPDHSSDGMTPYEALQHMYVYEAKKFDTVLLKRFIKLLGVYPMGSVVQLSSGAYGVVEAINPNKPLQPFVMIYSATVARETPIVIDLSEEITLTIKHCIHPNKLPQEVLNYLKPSKRVNYYILKNEEATHSTDKTATETISKTLLGNAISAKNTQQDSNYEINIPA